MEKNEIDKVESKMFINDSEIIKELFDHISEFNIDIETVENMPAFKDHINLFREL